MKIMFIFFESNVIKEGMLWVFDIVAESWAKY